MLTVIGLRANRGTPRGASIEAKVSPGTPATANIAVTRSGWVTASSNMVFTPMDQPSTGQAPTPAASSTASASSTKASTPIRLGSAGLCEPPVPRWFQEIAQTPQPGSSRAGQNHAVVPKPLHSSTVGPSPSLVQTSSTVPSRLVTS